MSVNESRDRQHSLGCLVFVIIYLYDQDHPSIAPYRVPPQLRVRLVVLPRPLCHQLHQRVRRLGLDQVARQEEHLLLVVVRSFWGGLVCTPPYPHTAAQTHAPKGTSTSTTTHITQIHNNGHTHTLLFFFTRVMVWMYHAVDGAKRSADCATRWTRSARRKASLDLSRNSRSCDIWGVGMELRMGGP